MRPRDETPPPSSGGPSTGRREAAMRSFPRLGAANGALASLYFAPVWGVDAFRALTSPFSGFEDRAHAVAAVYFQALFDLGLDGLVRTTNVLAGIKFVVAVGFLAYLIDFARALAVGREPNRETLDAVLVLAGSAIMLWAWPALGSGDGGLIRLHATQFVLLTGAMILLSVERHVEETARSRATAARSSAPPTSRRPSRVEWPAEAQAGMPSSSSTAPASRMA
jgi:hypothetical protein